MKNYLLIHRSRSIQEAFRRTPYKAKIKPYRFKFLADLIASYCNIFGAGRFYEYAEVVPYSIDIVSEKI